MFLNKSVIMNFRKSSSLSLEREQTEEHSNKIKSQLLTSKSLILPSCKPLFGVQEQTKISTLQFTKSPIYNTESSSTQNSSESEIKSIRRNISSVSNSQKSASSSQSWDSWVWHKYSQLDNIEGSKEKETEDTAVIETTDTTLNGLGLGKDSQLLVIKETTSKISPATT